MRLTRDEEREQYRAQHPYVVTKTGVLAGVISLRDILTARKEKLLSDIMLRPLSVPPELGFEERQDLFEQHPFLGIPVVDKADKLLGVVSKSAMAEAAIERSDADMLKVQGVVGDEIRSMATWRLARRRLSWLSVNILLNIIAASVIALYEETLAAMVALAVFLPIVSDMSGCSGNQAVAVSLRELSLGIAKPADVLRVWCSEITIGLINGVALGLLIAIAAWLWKGNAYLGLVVGTAFGLNTMIAVSIGGTVPLALKRFGVDPAVASGPILTTVTDMFGFFLILSLASQFLPLLLS